MRGFCVSLPQADYPLTPPAFSPPCCIPSPLSSSLPPSFAPFLRLYPTTTTQWHPPPLPSILLVLPIAASPCAPAAFPCARKLVFTQDGLLLYASERPCARPPPLCSRPLTSSFTQKICPPPIPEIHPLSLPAPPPPAPGADRCGRSCDAGSPPGPGVMCVPGRRGPRSPRRCRRRRCCHRWRPRLWLPLPRRPGRCEVVVVVRGGGGGSAPAPPRDQAHKLQASGSGRRRGPPAPPRMCVCVPSRVGRRSGCGLRPPRRRFVPPSGCRREIAAARCAGLERPLLASVRPPRKTCCALLRARSSEYPPASLATTTRCHSIAWAIRRRVFPRAMQRR
jgi:hypothetical protein